jgi:hypothetical protein
MAAKPDFIDLLNQAGEREFHVAVQQFLQHDKIEKIIKEQMPENIFDKAAYDAVRILIQEMKMHLTSAKGLIGGVKE